MAGAGGYAYATWIGFAPYQGTPVAEVFLARYDVAHTTWSDPVLLTPNDGVPTKAQHLVVEPGGALHLMYVEGLGPGGPEASRSIYHAYSQGNPLDPSQWSPRTEVSFEHTLAARSPWFAVSGDSAWVVYQCADNAGDWQVWGQKGHALVSSVVADDDTVTWSGAVYLDRDFLVASGGTLIIEPGTRVIAQANMDLGDVGNQSGKVEIVVDGGLFVMGTLSQPVTFTSTGQQSGDWGGILFRDTAADTTVSSLAYAEIDYPAIGVQVDTLACDLFHPRFVGAQKQICLDRDTRIAEGHEWNLDAPDTVTMRTANVILDHLAVHIVVDGALRTQSTQSGERVVFTSSSPDSLNGDDWYGITIRGDGWSGDGLGVGQIRDAEIAFASYPLSFWAADTALVENSLFHHYHDEAISDLASDATITDNVIWRGAGLAGLPDVFGRVGIHIGTSFGVCHGNQVFHQMQKGIWADFVSGYCNSPTQPPPRRALSIEDNDVIGDRSGPFANLDANGIEVSWACREQDVGVHDNNVQSWPASGIKVRQSSDVAISCNCVQGNGTGVWHRRDRLDYSVQNFDGYSVLGQNLLSGNLSSNMTTYGDGPRYEIRSPTAGIYGGAYAGAGRNALQLYDEDHWNWTLDAVQARTDVADSNSWRDSFGVALSDSVSIQLKNYYAPQDSQSIQLANFFTSAPDPPCQADWYAFCEVPVPPGGGGGAVVAGRPQGRAPTGHESSGDSAAGATAATEITDLPTVLALHAPRPNPTRDGVLMQLDVPTADAGRAEIRVYNVAGRRVRTLLSSEVGAGRREVAWDLRDEHGLRVSSGIYFARMELGENRAIHRIVVLK